MANTVYILFHARETNQNLLLIMCGYNSFSYFQVLILRNMNISDIKEFFSRFQHRQLQHLDLSWNHLRTIPLRSFFYLINLRDLDLSNNDLEAVGDLSGLSHLQVISQLNNSIYGSLLGMCSDFAHMSQKSKYLQVNCNKIFIGKMW